MRIRERNYLNSKWIIQGSIWSNQIKNGYIHFLVSLAGRLALLASRSTGLEKFGFIEIKPIFWDYPSFVLATEVSKVSFEVAYLVKNKFLCTAGAGRT